MRHTCTKRHRTTTRGHTTTTKIPETAIKIDKTAAKETLILVQSGFLLQKKVMGLPILPINT